MTDDPILAGATKVLVILDLAATESRPLDQARAGSGVHESARAPVFSIVLAGALSAPRRPDLDAKNRRIRLP
jgi:hypothetical protein